MLLKISSKEEMEEEEDDSVIAEEDKKQQELEPEPRTNGSTDDVDLNLDDDDKVLRRIYLDYVKNLTDLKHDFVLKEFRKKIPRENKNCKCTSERLKRKIKQWLV